MKAYITINQKALIEIAEAKGIKVDLVDSAIFDWIKTFAHSNKAIKKLINNKLYIWCSYSKIIEDNPLLGISSKDVIARRLNKLVKLGILEKMVSKEDGNKTFFHITEFAYEYLLESRNLSTQKSEPIDSKVGTLSTQKSDNSKLEDRELNRELRENKKKNKQKKKYLLDEALEDEKVRGYMSLLDADEEFIGELIEYRKDIKKPFKTLRGLLGVLKNLKEIKEQLGINPYQAFETMSEREWQTIEVSYLQKPRQSQQYRKEPERGSISWLIENGMMPDIDGQYRKPPSDSDIDENSIFDVEVE